MQFQKKMASWFNLLCTRDNFLSVICWSIKQQAVFQWALAASQALHTCKRVPPRGSMILIFLSLQAVARRLPSVLNDMERITSVWKLIVFTGAWMIDSLVSRFQIMIWSRGKHDCPCVPSYWPGLHITVQQQCPMVSFGLMHNLAHQERCDAYVPESLPVPGVEAELQQHRGQQRLRMGLKGGRSQHLLCRMWAAVFWNFAFFNLKLNSATGIHFPNASYLFRPFRAQTQN